MEENKYSRGKIYKLCPNVYEGEFIPYYGSTIEKLLSSRLSHHKNLYKRYKDNKIKDFCTSFNMFEKYGIDNIGIILIENYPCKSKYELESKEREWIEKTNCINKNIPTRTIKEWKEANKEHLQAYDKIHNKKYYEEHKEEILVKQKIYNEKNKEKIIKYRNELYNCECGGKYKYNHKARHLKSLKHNNYINNN